ncbi:tyrosine-type recombinase/integrase [Vibrio ziniensis]|uniref:Site-specific integrase n=1 Tax=Vibrio ziniensis TaxID=2711221 RepID=A0A6G7CH59_9VIBR|nr:site-specific integrase [Vibrio ziniensis]QIH41414.1 site-specific integrase [Vibrio ziniensis]
MPPKKLPTGVEIHSGMLRIWFIYKGDRYRESLKCPPTPKNIRIAAERRVSVCHAIRTGSFAYHEWFPESKHAATFQPVANSITMSQLFDEWLNLKSIEVTPSTLKNYKQRIKQVLWNMNGDQIVSSVTQSDLLNLRKKFTETCSASTVNTYMRTIKGVFGFAINTGYVDQRLLTGIKELKIQKKRPNPLTEEEFGRVIAACPHQQDENFWQLAVYSGLRHGELMALAWEDIDLDKKTITVCRNLALEGFFKRPKTVSGERVVNLLEPAVDALRKQKALTFMLPAIEIDVLQREHGKLHRYFIRPVFSPSITSRYETNNRYYHHVSIWEKWTAICKRAKITYRRPYQTRHTYACWMLSAGANPTFIAKQMGHSSAKEVYQTYGDWVSDHTQNQLDMLNNKYGQNAPNVPLSKVSKT